MLRMKTNNKRKDGKQPINGKKLIKKIGMAVLTCALLGCLTACDPTDKPSSKDRASSAAEQQTDADVLPILKPEDPITLRVGSLKGPTTMGLLFLMEDQKNGKTKNTYEFQMATGADELLPLMVSGKLDAALVPANVAAILCQKTDGKVVVVNVNTLGVLYLVSNDDSVKGIEDLKGKTIYLTGKGTTPDCVIQYLLKQAGYAEGEVKLEYKSEATEVVAILSQTEGALGFLPQPFVTAASMQNDKLKIVFSANDEWKKAQGTDDASGLVTGVTVVRKEVVEEHPEAIKTFLEEHAASAAAINADPDTGATYCVEAGIVAKEPIAKKAIPYCNVTCLTGKEMKQALQSYLEILYDFDKTTVGGALPGEDFYYLP
ncbi:MAG: ABC transporter substrate-binding protein [Acetatifactor sp.]|nr:ABC transporter substrate-binding protein [Acetatifactor sp.]